MEGAARIQQDGASTDRSRAVWWALNGLLAVTVVRAWHLAVAGPDMDAPLRLVPLAVVVAVLVVLAWAAERRSAEGPGVWVGRSREFWCCLAAFAAMLVLFDASYVRAMSDGRGYFAQAHSLVFDFDFDFSNDLQAFRARPEDAGRPPGTALLWAPFLLLADAWLALLNGIGAEHGRTGFEVTYQRAAGLATLIYGTLAIYWIARALVRQFRPAAAYMALGAIVLGTPVIWYVAVDASMAHGVSLFAATLFFSIWLRTREGRSRRQWAALAAAATLMILVRPQNVLLLGVLAVDAVGDFLAAVRAGDPATRARVIRTGGIAAGAAALVLAATFWLGSGYIAQHRVFTEWSIHLQLFAPTHGLISNSPVLLFAILGIFALAGTAPRLAIGLAAVVLAQVVVSGTSPGWNGGASFGARRFVACALPFAFGLAAAIEWARRRPHAAICVVLGGLVALNLSLVQDARTGRFTLSDSQTFETMTRSLATKVGNPFALPGSIWFAWQHDVPLHFLDRMSHRRHAQLQLDVGSEIDGRYLFGDWYPPEAGTTERFRWAGPGPARLFMQMRGRYYRLRFTASPFAFRGSPMQIATVTVNGEVLAEIPITRGVDTYEVQIPYELVPINGWLRVSWEFAYSRAPSDVSESADNRPLAVRFYSIELLPE